MISAGGDQQCGMLGQGVVKDGQVSLTLGTGGFLLTTCKEVPENLDWDVGCNASSAAGNYILEANMLTCTSAMEWCKRNFFREESDFYGRLDGIGMEIANNIASFEKYVPLQKILINGELSKCEAFERIREGARAKEYTVNKEKHEVYEKLRAKMTERYRRENV